jgi:ferredoxin
MKIFYFTATGNNLYVAKRIGGEIYSIPKLMKEKRYEFEDEKIGIVFPTYYGTVPKIVEGFLNKAKLKSNYFFAVATYGSLSRSVISNITEVGSRNGIKFSYANDLLMVDNYLPIFDMAKEIKKEPKKNIEESLAKILKDIENGHVYIKKYGAVMRFIGVAVDKLNPYPNGNEFEKNFSVESNCIGCGICEKVCPVNNIEIDQKPSFKGNCQQCLACANHCPQKAIRLKTEKSKVRYINKNVTLKEIITANN